ncbi:MAG: SLC13 family permease [Limnohabitans sp.]|nr:SLC13 family permease [Limnohabitans sp.]
MTTKGDQSAADHDGPCTNAVASDTRSACVSALSSDPGDDLEGGSRTLARIGLFIGPALAAIAISVTHPSWLACGGLTADASWVLGLLFLMSTWWVTLAVDPAVTGLVPFVALVVLGIGTHAQNAAPYADDVMFLFGGGSLIALALDRSGVSRRFAEGLIALAGSRPLAVLAAVMGATALMSAFVSNLATVATMLPLVLALGARASSALGDAPTDAQRGAVVRFSTSLLLGIAFASSIGGALTPIGSPPNPIAVDWFSKNGVEMDFLRWLRFSVPTTAVMLPLSMVVLGVWLFPAREIKVPRAAEHAKPLGRDGALALVVFLVAVTAWVTSELWKSSVPGIKDGVIAIAAAALLFLLPSATRRGEGLLAPRDFGQVPWRVLILFGGGLCLAEAMKRTGLSASLGALFESAGALPSVGVLLVVVAVLVFASEVASNTALAAMAVPIVGAIAPGLGVSPEQLVLPAVFAASWAFAMPVGTPPNALVFSTGRVDVRHMMRAGLVLDFVAIAVIVVMAKILL